MLERSSIPPWMHLTSVLVEMNRSWECGNEPANSRQTGKPANQQTSKPRCLQAALALPFALSALLVGEVLLRDVERAVLSLNIAAREVLADHAKHGELKAAEQQN